MYSLANKIVKTVWTRYPSPAQWVNHYFIYSLILQSKILKFLVNIAFNNYGHAEKGKGAATPKCRVVGACGTVDVLAQPQAVGGQRHVEKGGPYWGHNSQCIGLSS